MVDIENHEEFLTSGHWPSVANFPLLSLNRALNGPWFLLNVHI